MKNKISNVIFLLLPLIFGTVWASGGEASVRGDEDGPDRKLRPLFARGNNQGKGPSDKARAVFNFWTPARIAAAVPRDLLVDKSTGKGYIKDFGSTRGVGVGLAKRPNPKVYATKEYGKSNNHRSLADLPAAPNRKLDTDPPSFSNFDPAEGDSIGASHAFKVDIYDVSGLKNDRANFIITYPNGSTQTFTVNCDGNAPSSTCQVVFDNFSPGDWQWQVYAKDDVKGKGNSITSNPVSFTVVGGTPPPASLPQCNYYTSTTSEAFCHYDHPSVKNAEQVSGRLLYEMAGTYYVCSGTVAEDGTSGRSIVITAAHCVYDDIDKVFARNAMFIPDQDFGNDETDFDCSNDPIGCWALNTCAVIESWTTSTFPDNIPWDYAFYVVDDSGQHSGTASSSDALDEAVTMPWAIDFTTEPQDGNDYVRAFGYSYSVDPLFTSCSASIGRENGQYWIPGCEMTGGSSGGAWSYPFSPTSTNAQTIFTINSWGYTNAPGMSGPYLVNNSAEDLFNAAKNANLDGPGVVVADSCSSPEVCGDGIDNDCDGLVDCDDSECPSTDPACDTLNCLGADAWCNPVSGPDCCSDLTCARKGKSRTYKCA